MTQETSSETDLDRVQKQYDRDMGEQQRSSAEAEAAAPSPQAEAGTREVYTVKEGDTLSAIAERFYGDGNAYNRIFEANRDKLDNPDMIHPGQELTIPE